MCGRFVNINKMRKIEKLFDIKNNLLKNESISYNIAPSQKINVILFNKEYIIENLKWGINFFDRKQNINKQIINSRVETIGTNLFFKESYNKKRCLVPSNGYYEWSIKNGIKDPYFFEIPNLETFFFPAIWKFDNFKENLSKSFSIITKPANNQVKYIHHRMPIILSYYEAINYINNDKTNYFDKNFVSDIEPEIDYHKVSKFVNSPLNNSIECIKFIN